MVPSLIGPFDVYWLAAGGALGALARALWTSGQKNLGLETAQDVIIGACGGLLWNLEFTVPGLGFQWPLIPLPVHANEIQRAALVGVIMMVLVSTLKRLLFTFVPAYMDKLTGGVPNGIVSSAPPPPGAPKP